MIIELIALGALFLSACAASEASQRRDAWGQSAPEWTKDLGTSPEIAQKCDLDESIAQERAKLAARAAIVDHYCGQSTGPGLRSFDGRLVMSSPRRMFTERQGAMSCVTVEMTWGGLQCFDSDGRTSRFVVNPKLNIQ